MEGGRCADSGNMAGAWDCYRAILRMYVHLRRRERLKNRLRADLHLGELQQRLAKWAADPRTTIPQLRRALEEVVACRPRPEWDAFTLKREYLDLMRFLDGPVNPPPEQIEEELTYRLGDVAVAGRSERYGSTASSAGSPASPNAAAASFDYSLPTGWRMWRTPTRSDAGRRCERAFHIAQRTTSVCSIPSAPTHRQALACCHRRRWQAGWSRPTMPEWPSRYEFLAWPAVRQTEQRGYRELLVLLASELYRRERGTLPPSEEALVGTYLESLPDDGSADLADETTPTVE